MGTTLTIRTDPALRRALGSRAKQSGKTVSEFVREILEEALAERPMAERTAHVKGRLELPKPAGEWRKQLRQRNWRP
jgi:plasmid stability protein